MIGREHIQIKVIFKPKKSGGGWGGEGNMRNERASQGLNNKPIDYGTGSETKFL